jgi:RNA polymerase sigma-70 factor (ECF subfamily)
MVFMTENDNRQLIENYLKGDESSLEFLIKKNIDSVYSFIFRQVGDTEIAKDLTQETFIKVWKNIKKFKVDKNFKTWLFTIAKNIMIDFWRKKKTIPFSDLNSENDEGEAINWAENSLVDESPLPSEIFDRENLADELNEIMKNLSDKQREIIWLYHREDFTFVEIGEILKESVNSVKSCYRRGILALKSILLNK